MTPPDNTDVYERYMNGTINGDVEALEKLIYERLNENPFNKLRGIFAGDPEMTVDKFLERMREDNELEL